MAWVHGQFFEQEEFQPGQRDRAVSRIGRQPAVVQAELADPDGLAVSRGSGAMGHAIEGNGLRIRRQR